MVAIGSAELVAEMERSVRASPGRTSQMLRRVADLFSLTAGRLNQGQLDIFDEVLTHLGDHAEPQALAELSQLLADIPSARLQIVRRLARHEDATIASPLLRKSEYLSDEDLIEIAACRSPAHALAIAQRASLGEAIVDVLLDHGDTGVCVLLAKSCGAKFSSEGYSRLARMAERNDELADLFVSRADVPPEVLHRLLASLPRSVRARLLKVAAPQLREAVKTVIESVEATICTKAPERVDYSEAQARIIELNKTGKLNDSTINRFATWREYRNLVAALSHLATVPTETIEALLHEREYYGLAIACRASRLNWNTALAVISNRPDQARLAASEIEQAKDAFESLNLSTAQRLIRFGSVSDFALKFGRDGDSRVAGAG
jgi:uncharacterized protein (DUF2336 family)